MNGKNRIARGVGLLSAIVMLVSAYSCAAPDALPGPDVDADAGLPDTDSGTEADAPPDAPDEPPAGDPVWGVGFGAMVGDQQSFDVALASPDSVVATIGFATSIGIPNVGMLTASSARNIVVAKFANDGSGGKWATQIKCSGEIIRSVVDVDPMGNSIVAGGFNGIMTIEDVPVTLPASNYDAYIAKFDPTGKFLWVKTFGEVHYQQIADVAVDAEGNIIVVGVTEGAPYKFGTTIDTVDITPPPGVMGALDDDIFVAKFDADGNIIWAKRLGFAVNNIPAEGTGSWLDPSVTVAVSPKSGAIVVGGTFQKTIMLGPDQVTAKGKEDGFVVQYDAGGTRDWKLTFGDDNRSQRVTSVAYGRAGEEFTGEVFVTGWFQGTIAFEGEGNTLNSYNTSKSLLVMKIGADGKPVWARGYGAQGDQVGSSILVDQKNQPIVLGSFTGVLDFFGSGTLVNANASTTTDLFSAKFSASGKPFWAHAYGDLVGKVPDNQYVGGAVLCKDGTLDRAIVAGMNRGTLDLGSIEPLQSLGAEDAYIMSITY